jgi:hypothetical protein
MLAEVFRMTLKDIEAEVFWFNPVASGGDVRVRLYNSQTGQPLQLVDLWLLTSLGANSIYISLNINIEP